MDGLNLGNLCKLMLKWEPKKFWRPPGAIGDTWMVKTGVISQSAVVELVYAMVYEHDQVDIFAVHTVGSHANGVLQNTSLAKKEIRERAQCCTTQLILDNFQDLYFNELTLEQRRGFVQELQGLVEQTDFGFDPLNLRFYTAYTYDDNAELNTMSCRFAANAIYWCLLGPNTEKDVQSRDVASLNPWLPKDIAHYDPYSRDYHKKNSTALRFELIDQGGAAEDICCHSHERALELVVERGLVITRIECEHGVIRLHYSGRAGEGLTLRRLEREDIPAAVAFVQDHLWEFKPKWSWGERTLAQMTRKGLETGKWTAYAYFNSSGKMVAYLDYKMRSDGEIELGVQLTDPVCRKQKLATGLVNFHRFKFMNNRLFVSTFEENGAMRHVLEVNGFRPNYFYDPKTKLATNIIRERIHPDDPQNKKLWTNSVYYFADSVLSTMN